MEPGCIVADRFEILSIAGSGGMGVVYRARDRKTGDDVALKVLRNASQDLRERFAREVELLAGIDHPRVVGHVSHGVTEDGVPYLVMPWLEGIDLQTRLASGPLSVDETATLARHVADALAYLHAKRIVHRDLKPSNLFLPGGRVEDVRVMDLGIARADSPASAVTISGVLVGTPAFMAPEQAQGGRVTPSADIFALGCVLFECLTGRRLFQGEHLMAVLAKILIEEAPRVRELRPDAPEALDTIIHRMVAKDPATRPGDGARLAAWLADLQGVPTLEATPSQALTASERRVVSVLVVALPRRGRPVSRTDDTTWAEGGPFLAASTAFGVRVHMLGDRTAIVLAPDDVSSSDQAATLARFAMRVREQLPGAAVALTTGRALVRSRLPVGDAIDKAVAMVRSVAPGEGVHVDEVTAALITSRFDVRRAGRRTVITEERRSLDPTRVLLGKPTSCVGRDAELALLEAMLTDCEMGNGPKVLLVTAPAGVGKSRLRHEFVRRLAARRNPVMVLQAGGDALRLSKPYGIAAEIVRQAIGVREHEPIERVRQKLADHVSSLLEDGEAPRVTDFLGELVSASFKDRADGPLRAARRDANAMADQIRVAFEDVARAWSERQSVVLVLEDLHWGDVASMRLLDAAVRKLAGAPVFVLALARPEVHERVSDLFGNRDMTEIRLPSLSRRASTRLVEEALGDDVRRDEAQRIIERAEGNAFYLEELIRAVAERRDDLPETVIAVAQARLDRLEPRMRKVLRAASVYGDVFWLEGVAALVGEPPATIEPIVATLIEHETVTASDPPRFAGVREFAFRHTILRGAAYSTLTDEDRSLGHRIAAKWLQDLGEDPEVVALHWLEGGDPSRAAERFARAADERWGRAQAEAAARCALRALLASDGSIQDATFVGDRLRLLAAALKATRHLDHREAVVGLERHMRAAQGGDGAGLVRMAAERGMASLGASIGPGELTRILADAGRALAALSAFADAEGLVDRARAAAGDDERLLRHARWAAARIAFWQGDYGATWETLSQTVLPEDGHDRLETLLMLATAVVSVHGPEALVRGLDFVSRAEMLLSSEPSPGSLRQDPVARVHCAKARASCFYFTAHYASAADATEETARLAHQAGLRFDECSHLHNLAELWIRLDQRGRARTLLEQSSSIARDTGSSAVEHHNAILSAYLDGSSEKLARFADEARETKHRWRDLHARYWLGRLHLERGAPEARTALHRALDLARSLRVKVITDECTVMLTKCAAT